MSVSILSIILGLFNERGGPKIQDISTMPSSTERGTDCCEIVENANSIILTWDTQGKIMYMNKFGQQFFGYTSDELVGKSIIGKILPEMSRPGKSSADMIKDILKNPEQYVSNDADENIKKSGERVRLLWSNKVIRNRKGDIVKIISVGNVPKEYL
ncbi:PAS domain-containing protein [Methanooceanicella nereidis]|nr:PAS domain-containing protein [Methanocella sp. CWC-04]